MSPSIDTRETRAFAFETKFLIDPAQAAMIRAWARTRLNPDPNAAGAWSDEYLTTSIYFDTPEFDVFRRQGSYGRMKFRARRYGQSPEIYLERKLRNTRMLSKRRTSVTMGEITDLAGTSRHDGWAADWFHRRLLVRGLKPVCQVSYKRTARVAESTHGVIRLTIDDDIRALPAAGFAFQTSRGATVLDGQQILELKYRFAMPAVFKHLVEEFALMPMAVSKYPLSALVALEQVQGLSLEIGKIAENEEVMELR